MFQFINILKRIKVKLFLLSKISYPCFHRGGATMPLYMVFVARKPEFGEDLRPAV